MDVETALIVPCPAADDLMGDSSHLDRSARVGVPAHITVSYPFKCNLTDEDHQALGELFLSFPAFAISGERTGWFDDTVVFIELADPGPVIAMTESVQSAFPLTPSMAAPSTK